MCFVHMQLLPAVSAASGGMSGHLTGQALDMPCTPDIVLLPSDLAPFAKVAPCGDAPSEAASPAALQKIVCINPGRLVRDKSGATYAWLQVCHHQ